ncbi:hypothetical protein [Fundidesulfovibrio agrisoli]|uniref:hypothetical protein n=1 Tax=Fundidesulfovibrio agrisoli TaxID=2922717 RepID=UPI001FAD44D2|nr:hypothetical protein [Fundidesulfovibrio agrisoli]
MRRTLLRSAARTCTLGLCGWLAAGMLLLGDWSQPLEAMARGAVGPRGGAAAVGPRGGAAAVGPRGGAAVRGPYGGAAARGPYGGAAVRGPYGGGAAVGPRGNAVAVPRGRVVPPPVPVPVPVPGPGYYGGYYGPSGGAVAAGMAMGAMLTVLPATAIAISSSGRTVYKVDRECYREMQDGGRTVYEQIPCP